MRLTCLSWQIGVYIFETCLRKTLSTKVLETLVINIKQAETLSSKSVYDYTWFLYLVPLINNNGYFHYAGIKMCLKQIASRENIAIASLHHHQIQLISYFSKHYVGMSIFLFVCNNL